jgi:hypothetical protein
MSTKICTETVISRGHEKQIIYIYLARRHLWMYSTQSTVHVSCMLYIFLGSRYQSDTKLDSIFLNSTIFNVYMYVSR